MTVNSKEDVYALLVGLGAPDRLLTHLKLVAEAADELCKQLKKLGVAFDDKMVEIGVAVHDAGKIEHPLELDVPGGQHEPAGEKLMLENGIPSHIARFCLSHARYEQMEASFEELVVALSDKLWKGKRVEALEMKVIDKVAIRMSKKRWDIYTKLDDIFERIAAAGGDRLERSR